MICFCPVWQLQIGGGIQNSVHHEPARSLHATAAFPLHLKHTGKDLYVFTRFMETCAICFLEHDAEPHRQARRGMRRHGRPRYLYVTRAQALSASAHPALYMAPAVGSRWVRNPSAFRRSMLPLARIASRRPTPQARAVAASAPVFQARSISRYSTHFP